MHGAQVWPTAHQSKRRAPLARLRAFMAASKSLPLQYSISSIPWVPART